MRVDGFAPIRAYAAIGDGRAVALVACDGSVDWLCLPGHDSPSVFGALLDPEAGGRFALAPSEPFTVERRYLPETNVLETTFRTGSGALRVTDAMTMQDGGLAPWREVARRVEGLAGRVPVQWSVEPRFGYGKRRTRIERRRGHAVAVAGPDALAVHAWDGGEPEVTAGAVRGRFEAREGARALLALTSSHGAPVHIAPRESVEQRLDGTIDAWRRWVRGNEYEGPWKEAVLRSVLALKLLVSAGSGAIVAAPTTSLPERIGGSKNYDYRYVWLRDSTFTLEAFLRLGYHEQAHHSFVSLLDAIATTHPRLQPIYTLDGGVLGGQRELSLRGYRGSRPVHEGNGAAAQLQLGGYGDLLTTTWLYVRDGNSLDEATRARLREVTDLARALWRNEDSGIWELDRRRHYTQSKMACWAAFDRALRLVGEGELPGARASGWRREAETIRSWIEANCWSAERRAYTQHAGGIALDASCLLAARMEYGDPGGERILGTIEAVRRELGDGPFLYRYSGASEEEGAFVACSFWLVEALARAGRLDEAAETMEAMVGQTNDVGLLSEQIDPGSRDFLGNFPQGLSHLALVNAAALFAESASAREKEGNAVRA